MVGDLGAAHKPDWVELEVLWTSSRTLELSGIYSFPINHAACGSAGLGRTCTSKP